MTTLFERIIAGDIPARWIGADAQCIAFLTIAPVRPGHVLVVPREPIDHWIDAPDALMAHLVSRARLIGAAQLAEFGGLRCGLVIQGYGVPHLHLHVFPSTGPEDFNEPEGSPASEQELDDAAARLRGRLQHAGDIGEGFVSGAA